MTNLKISYPESQEDQPGVPLNVEYLLDGEHIRQQIQVNGQLIGASRALPEGADLQDSPSALWWKSYLQGSPIIPDNRVGRLKFIDLFCASGGLSLGFEEAALSLGMRTRSVLGMDMDRRALEVYQANHSPTFTSSTSVSEAIDFHSTELAGKGIESLNFEGDPKLLLPELKQAVGTIDVVLAGPPCQGHSSLNNATRHDDARNELYAYPAAIAIALGARAVVIENVPGVQRDRGSVFQRTEALLKNSGYTVEGMVIKAENLGWPQTRHRYFLVAVKDGAPGMLSETISALTSPPRTLGWAIADLQGRQPNGILDSTPTLSEENKSRIEWLVKNKAHDLDDQERPDCHKNKDHSYKSSYGRMWWDRPAGTLTTGFMSPGRGRFIHPLEPRVLTPREAARVQGFPDPYFENTSATGDPKRGELAKWIGDAVPAPLGFAASLAVVAQLLKT